MKKIVTTILLLVYMVTSSGATIQLHYCMDRLVGWSLSATGTSTCVKCGMEKKGHKGCCHDEDKTIKVDRDQKASDTFLNVLVPTVALDKSPLDYRALVWIFNPVLLFPTNNAPPSRKKLPLFIYLSVFRI